MFASLAERLQETFKKLKGKGRLNESDVNDREALERTEWSRGVLSFNSEILRLDITF